MHIEILQENLLKGLNIVSRSVPSHPTIPVLGMVYLESKDGQLVIIGGNGETIVQTFVGAKVLTEGGVCLPIRTLLEFISTLPSGKIELFVEKDVLKVTSGAFKGKINGQAGSDYPEIKFPDNPTIWKIKKEELNGALEKLLFCAAVDESRPALTGVSFKPIDGGLQLAATDSFRLSVVKLPLLDFPQEIVVSAKILNELKHLSDEEKQKEISFFISGNTLCFEMEDSKILTQSIQAKFPQYEKIIPSKSEIKIVAKVQSFLKSVKTASVFAKGNSNIVKLCLSLDRNISLKANAASLGEQESIVEGTIESELSEEFVVAFNWKYLSDFLNTVVEPEVILEFTTTTSPVLFTIPNQPTFLQVIMPVRV